MCGDGGRVEESSAAVLLETALVSGHFTLSVFNPLLGATSKNVCSGPRAERPKTSGRDQCTRIFPYNLEKIS